MNYRNRTVNFTAGQTVALLITMALGVSFIAHAGGVAVPNTFVPGDTARADDVNANFEFLANAISDLQTQVAQLEDQLAAIDDATQFISVSTETINGLAGPHVIVEGANLHVRSGTGATDDNSAPSGLGNVVIGYNVEQVAPGTDDRSGAHNLVIGDLHKYSATGGIVAGLENEITGLGASVLGGTNNLASGTLATVSGGGFNQASGEQSSVTGGVSNSATSLRSSATGGAQNTVSGTAASISGGSGGAAGGFASSISGGQSGIASGDQSSITGGQSNSAFGEKATVSGGFNQIENNDFGWRACGLTCP